MRSTWRTDPVDARPFVVRSFAHLWAVFLVKWPDMCATAVFLFLLTGLLVVLGWSSPYAFFLPILALVVQWMSFAEQSAMPADVSSLIDEPSRFEQSPVDVEIHRSGVLFGVDTGVLSNVDGWLYFAGTQTEFSLAASRSMPLDPSDLAAHGIQTSFPLGLSLSDGSVVAMRSHNSEAVLNALVRGWQRSTRVIEGVELLPPESAQPKAVTLSQLRLARAVLSASSVAVVLVCWTAVPKDDAFELALSLLVPFVLMGATLVRARRSIKILRASLDPDGNLVRLVERE